MTRWLGRRALAARLMAGSVFALIVLVGRPAWADTTIALAPDSVPATTAKPEAQACAGGKPGTELWIFAVRDAPLAMAGELRSITATFRSPSGELTTMVTDEPLDGAAGPAGDTARIRADRRISRGYGYGRVPGARGDVPGRADR